MKIRYQMDEDHEGRCLTPCPHGMPGRASDDTIRVGSAACEVCQYNKGHDVVNQEVECESPTMTRKEALRVIELNAGRLSISMQMAIKTLIDERIALTEYVRDRMKAVMSVIDDNERYGFDDNGVNDALLAELGDLVKKIAL